MKPGFQVSVHVELLPQPAPERSISSGMRMNLCKSVPCEFQAIPRFLGDPIFAVSCFFFHFTPRIFLVAYSSSPSDRKCEGVVVMFSPPTGEVRIVLHVGNAVACETLYVHGTSF